MDGLIHDLNALLTRLRLGLAFDDGWHEFTPHCDKGQLIFADADTHSKEADQCSALLLSIIEHFLDAAHDLLRQNAQRANVLSAVTVYLALEQMAGLGTLAGRHAPRAARLSVKHQALLPWLAGCYWTQDEAALVADLVKRLNPEEPRGSIQLWNVHCFSLALSANGGLSRWCDRVSGLINQKTGASLDDAKASCRKYAAHQAFVNLSMRSADFVGRLVKTEAHLFHHACEKNIAGIIHGHTISKEEWITCCSSIILWLYACLVHARQEVEGFDEAFAPPPRPYFWWDPYDDWTSFARVKLTGQRSMQPNSLLSNALIDSPLGRRLRSCGLASRVTLTWIRVDHGNVRGLSEREDQHSREKRHWFLPTGPHDCGNPTCADPANWRVSREARLLAPSFLEHLSFGVVRACKICARYIEPGCHCIEHPDAEAIAYEGWPTPPPPAPQTYPAEWIDVTRTWYRETLVVFMEILADRLASLKARRGAFVKATVLISLVGDLPRQELTRDEAEELLYVMDGRIGSVARLLERAHTSIEPWLHGVLDQMNLTVPVSAPIQEGNFRKRKSELWNSPKALGSHALLDAIKSSCVTEVDAGTSASDSDEKVAS